MERSRQSSPKTRNRLAGDHLNACMRLFAQDFFTLETFPYEAAIALWNKAAAKRGCYHG